MNLVLPLSLCVFVKNEAASIRDCFESVLPVVSEIVVVDTGSTDGTVDICRKYTDRIYQVGFSDFGSIRTLSAHLAAYPWVLMLDADERIDAADWGKLAELVSVPVGVSGDDWELDKAGELVTDSWALPRKRWADEWMHEQLEKDVYPDWQVRLFRNYVQRPKIYFERRVHERVAGCVNTVVASEGPTIHHFQNVFKPQTALLARQALYERLQAADIAEGIQHDIPAVVELDNVKNS